MRYRGRPILGAVAGALFGAFLALDLVFFKVVSSGSPLIVVLPLLGFVLGLAGGLLAPFGRAAAARKAGIDVPPGAPAPPEGSAPAT